MTSAKPELINDMSEVYPEFDLNSEIIERARAYSLKFDNVRHRVDIEAAAIHPEKEWLAWVEFRGDYFLKAVVDDQLAVNWRVKTYNPFFGCSVHYLAWHGEHIVMIYTEKHRIYAANLSFSGVINLVEVGSLGSRWSIYDHIIACLSLSDSFVHQWTFPDLVPLPTLRQEEALAAGILRQNLL